MTHAHRHEALFYSDADEFMGRGLWMANQLCELVQIRSFPDGGAVRVHKRLR